jgi:hypothetical protein
MILYKAEGSKTMRELGVFKAVTDDALLFSLEIIAKLSLFVREKKTRKTGASYEKRTVSRNVGALAAQPSSQRTFYRTIIS